VELRAHQQRALDAITAAAADGHERMTVASACGSGKTLVAQRAAQHLAPQGAVLVLLPTRALLTQTVRRWREAGHTGVAVGVCTLGQAESGLRWQEARMLRDSSEIARALATSGPVTVFCTYSSLHRIRTAHEQNHLPAWDLIVADEAHRTCSAFGEGWGMVHDDRAIPAKVRLYMTATPRVWGADTQLLAHPDMERPPLATMDHADIFGPTVYRLGMAEAIERGILADYQVLLPVVDTDAADLHAILSSRYRGTTAHHDGLRNAAVQVAVLRAIVEQGLRRVLVFHNRIALAEAFAGTLPETARQLPAPLHHPHLWARAIHSQHSAEERRLLLEDFGTLDAACKVLSNVRVLNEGVDMPDVDGVVFIDPRYSLIDAIQAIGRGLRQPPGAGKKTTLVIPVYLHSGTATADLMRDSAFANMITLLQALRAHDETFMDRIALPVRSAGSAVSAQRSAFYAQPERAVQLAHVLGVKIQLPAIGSWDTALTVAADYHALHGDLHVPPDYCTKQGFALGEWLASIRLRHLLGRHLPSKRRQVLDGLGFSWSGQTPTTFDIRAARARAWAAQHGHLIVPVKEEYGGYRLGEWLSRMRHKAKAGHLTAAQIQVLDAIDPHWNPVWPLDWQRRYHHAKAALAAPAPAGTVQPSAERRRSVAADWFASQYLHFFHLHPGQQALLFALRTAPPPGGRARWALYIGMGHAAVFLAREGHLDISPEHREPWYGPPMERDPHAFALGAWLHHVRTRPRTLPREMQRSLDTLLVAAAERPAPAGPPPGGPSGERPQPTRSAHREGLQQPAVE